MATYDFQERTAERIAYIFNETKQKRVLCADEVGLGKTIIARKVMELVRERKGENRFRVVYVCSNMNIVRQNISKLVDDEEYDVSENENRLSMQHFVIAKENNDRFIPLTPGTSFLKQGMGTGDRYERALIVVILSRMPELSDRGTRTKIKNFFRGNQIKKESSSWEEAISRYNDDVKELGEKYISNIQKRLHSHKKYKEKKDELLRILEKPSSDRVEERSNIINDFRKIFIDISLSMLKPDLIIMDEFQRFSELLPTSDDIEESEQTLIAKKIFGEGEEHQPFVLLLSATPYKPFSTLEELTVNNMDEHYKDFLHLMDFLVKDKEGFKKLWSDYSCELMNISSDSFENVCRAKDEVEKELYKVMCRSERLNDGLISAKDAEKEMTITSDDIRSFCEMQRIVHGCKKETGHFGYLNIPVDYVKSSPYLLSYMEYYEIKKQIEEAYKTRSRKLPLPTKQVLIQKNFLDDFCKISMRNARLQYLHDIILPENKLTELLLWVPASKPYYTTDVKNNPFELNRDFSKILVFSAWEMVPRMISTMMTYEVERRIVSSKYKIKCKGSKYDAKEGEGRIGKEEKEILSFPSLYLSDVYDPEESLGCSIRDVKKDIRGKIEDRFRGIQKTHRPDNPKKIIEIIRWLDNRRGSEYPETVSESTIKLLVDMAIASPGVCLYRILRDEKLAKAVAKECFVTIFARRMAGCIIDVLKNKNTKLQNQNYLSGVMEYCVMGNLQAVLDEYVYMICPEWESGDDAKAKKIAKTIQEASIMVPNLKVDTNESFPRKSSKKSSMRISYAVPFAQNKTSVSKDAEKRNNNIRNAFLSPFYPFVLASTSVGQEGLDFHWYCRKVMHWNLPSNPQDIEQREGRINRYQCLAIRRNLAKMKFNKEAYSWKEIFGNAIAEKEKHPEEHSDMVPNWCLLPEWIDSLKEDGIIEWIERIVPQYPMSADGERYKRLIKILSLYRLTMGQPRQEELLDMLSEKNLSVTQIERLLFNLSPIKREK